MQAELIFVIVAVVLGAAVFFAGVFLFPDYEKIPTKDGDKVEPRILTGFEAFQLNFFERQKAGYKYG